MEEGVVRGEVVRGEEVYEWREDVGGREGGGVGGRRCVRGGRRCVRGGRRWVRGGRCVRGGAFS